MNLSLIFHESYCNELLDLYQDRKSVKKYIQLAQVCAAIQHIIDTPYFSICMRQIQSIAPYTMIHEDDEFLRETSSFFDNEDSDMEQYAVRVKQLYTLIERQKKSLQRFLDKMINTQPDNMVTLIKDKIKKFMTKKNEACKSATHMFEFIVERQRFKKIIAKIESLESYKS